MWNSLILSQPPINTYKVPVKSLILDINAVSNVFEKGISSFSDQVKTPLQTESLILSRCVYKMKLQFRNDKGFKCMEKTNTLLRKFLKFDIVKDLRYFYKTLPKKYEKDVYFPSRQMIEYILVRLQGYSKLASRITESALATAKLMNSRLALGQLWTTAAVVISLVSRIWFICKFLTRKCCFLYNDLLPLRENLQKVGVEWLEPGYEFPTNLFDWLEMDWLQEKEEISSQIRLEIPIFNLLEDSDEDEVEFCSQYYIKDFIIIDDESIVGKNDLEFIDEYKLNNKKSQQSIPQTISDSESSCIEISDNKSESSVVPIFPTEFPSKSEICIIDDSTDTGEVVSRENHSQSVINLISSPDSTPRASKKKRKFKKNLRKSNLLSDIKKMKSPRMHKKKKRKYSK